MLDLFSAAPQGAPAPFQASEKIQHKGSYVELPPEKADSLRPAGGGGTPKKFSRAFGDLPHAPNTTKIEPENSKKNTNSENRAEDSVTDRGIVVADRRKARMDEKRANRLRIQQGNPKDPKPYEEWVAHPEWHERRAPPLRRGYRNQRPNVESILAQVETPKPELPEWLAEADAPTVVDYLIAFVEAGGTQSEFCRRTGITTYHVSKAVDTVQGGRERLETARRTVGADALAEEALRIATEPLMTEESIETYDRDNALVQKSIKRADNVYARKLAYQARMSLLQKWAPERYGENVKPAVGDGMAERLRKARDRLMGEFYSARRELSLPPNATEHPGSRDLDLSRTDE